jgi:hypothetical protein
MNTVGVFEQEREEEEEEEEGVFSGVGNVAVEKYKRSGLLKIQSAVSKKEYHGA